MPTLKLFKKSHSKSNASQEHPAPDVPANDKEDVPRPITTTSDDAVPEYSDSLKEAWAAAHRDLPKAQGAEKLLNTIGNVQGALTLSPGQLTVVDTLATPAKALMDTTKFADSIHKGVNAFMEAVPPLMKALDEVGNIHPFIKVAVLAFKAVYTLEKKRRENDKRILALYVEMKDTMEVLLSLRGIADPDQIAPDGKSIRGRMQKLCEDVAQDIDKCAEVCDTYISRKILIKIFAGPIWEGRLVEFVDVFTKRRGEFEFAMALHTTAGVDAANLKLETVDKRTAEISQKMDAMRQLFEEFVTPQQKVLTAKMEAMGGYSVLEDEQAMKELASAESALSTGSGPESRSGGGRAFNFVELQQEINADPKDAIEKNSEFFNRKFDIQKREIVDEITRAFNRGGDRVILAILEGPHDRIVDPDIYEMWKEMRWRGSVKAQRFVLALRDHYIDKAAGDSGSITGPDSWALKYINLGRMRSILEAFDDDASGFVTVNEVNSLAQSRPLRWSLPHWIAYWAIGWQMTCTAYCVKIEEIFDAMISLSSEVLPENKQAINKYVDAIWRPVTIFVQSIEREEGSEELRSKFEPHVTAEESRLRRNFEVLNYRIDSSDTVRVISGEGRLETTLFPMFYLALKRDLEKISLARKYVLSEDELSENSTAILPIGDVAWDRMASLKGIFKQQNLEARDQFEVFAKGLYNTASTPGAFHQLQDLSEPIPCREEIIPDPDSIPLSILHNPLKKRHEIDFAAYDPPELTLSPAEGAHPLLGVYYGFIYDGKSPSDPMMKFTLGKGDDEDTFVASGTHYRGGWYKDYKITGNWGSPLEDGKIPVEFKIAYSANYQSNTELKGLFDPEENSLRGTMAMQFRRMTGEFVFKRDPDFVRLYPAPCVMNARKRWEFATTLVLDRVRQRAWSTKRILQRIRDGKRFVELALRQYLGRTYGWDEMAELLNLLNCLYEADIRFYGSLVYIHLEKTTIFDSIVCNNCFTIPEGSRIICLDCRNETTLVNLCSEPECVNCTIKFHIPGRKPHLPTHGMFKVHRFVFLRDMARVGGEAKSSLEFARRHFAYIGVEEGPECAHCKTVVSPPCWFCSDCQEETYICDDCEYRGLAFGEKHTKMHTVVRVFERGEEKERLTEERLQFLEDKLGRMEETLVEVRQTLAILVEKSGAPSRSEPVANGDVLAG
ncbi:hypothetical protein BJ322DRAFT_1161455 [Thelephora terrestris]|uniref:EF-hand domain-containing protein n=1 Tax=Thelephora terrestris TaxID=56493 RepID=A0A9P6H8R1_9AGAM|nr:hypothetical protein BJ322DRAFT_1161455 [Thelephora terrestris]